MSGEKCVEIMKTLHVKFFPFGSLQPPRIVTVKLPELVLPEDISLENFVKIS